MAAATVLLLPPSETKQAGGTGPGWDPAAAGLLAADRVALLSALREAGTTGRLAPASVALTLASPGSATVPALKRYTGVLFDALSVSTLPRAVRRRADSRIAIVSGLAGLVLGGDPLPDYKLPMGTVVPGLGGLGAWWKPRLRPVLDAFVAGMVTWDLLPGAHAAAWSPGGTWRVRWQVKVLREAPDGTRSVVSHENKTTKGALARHILTVSARGPRDIIDWVGPGGAALDLASSVVTRSGGMLAIVAPAPGHSVQIRRAPTSRHHAGS